MVGGSAASGGSDGVSAAVSAGGWGVGGSAASAGGSVAAAGGGGLVTAFRASNYKVHIQGVVISEKDMVAVNFISPSTQPLQLQYTVACTGRQASVDYMYSLWYIR